MGLNCLTVKQLETSTKFHAIVCHNQYTLFPPQIAIPVIKRRKCVPNKMQ